MLGWAGIKKEVVVVANVDLWEIWDKDCYEKIMNNDWNEFDALAADVMGDSSDEE